MKLKNTWLTLFSMALLVCVSGTVLAQQARQGIAADSVIEEIKKRGSIKVGLSMFVPWSMRNKEGELIGYEIDVAKKLAADMEVEIEFFPTAWDGIIPALISGKFDVIISGMSITPKRNLTVNFTAPYANSGLAIVANKQLTEGFTTLEDFNSPEVKFSLRRGATPVAFVQSTFPKAELLQFDEDGASLQEVVNGNSHATVASEPTPTLWIENYPDTMHRPFDQLFDKRSEAFAIRKGDPDALNFFNNWIQIHWDNGWLKERHDYWFKTRDWKDQVAE